ncbi:unnamed protein product, partial [Brassica rapa]
LIYLYIQSNFLTKPTLTKITNMFTKPIILASLLLIVFVSATHSARHKSGNDGSGFGGVPGFDGIPGFGNGFPGTGVGGGYGGGYGGPSGGFGKGGVVRPTVTCRVKGPCNGKKLRCPAKCFSSFSRSGKGYGGGGGGGGCTMDCKKKCIAYC